MICPGNIQLCSILRRKCTFCKLKPKHPASIGKRIALTIFTQRKSTSQASSVSFIKKYPPGALIYVEDWLLWEDSIGHGFAGWALFDDFSKHDKRDDTKSCKEVEGHSVRRNGFVHNALYIHKRRGNCGPASQLVGFSRLLIWQLPMVSCACQRWSVDRGRQLLLFRELH